jgi:hypothetical protein
MLKWRDHHHQLLLIVITWRHSYEYMVIILTISVQNIKNTLDCYVTDVKNIIIRLVGWFIRVR